jgi:hypothetical protein
MEITSVGWDIDSVNTCQFQFFFTLSLEPENCRWFQLLEKEIRIKELLVPDISKTLKELAVFMKEPVKNQWFDRQFI